MTKIITWNVGSFFFLKYFKYFKIKFKKQPIEHEYFQPILNGAFISNNIEKMDPDIVFLQEFYNKEDKEQISILKKYPYQEFINTWYHKHSILVASKNYFQIKILENFSIIQYKSLNIIPVHLNSFSSSKRLADVIMLNKIISQLENVVVLGDTNFWSRGSKFVFLNDKTAYQKLVERLVDASKNITSTSFFGFGFDKIFHSKNIQIKDTSSPKIRNCFMDHYPICVGVI